MTRPTHVTKGDVFDDLGFSKSESSVLKLKAELLDAILSEVRRRGYSQRDLVDILDEHQPNVSSLLHGKISKVSIERLLTYADRLNLRTEWKVSRSRRAVAVA